MIVSIHQPQYLPWIPYIRKIKESDIFVSLDDVQYQKNGLQNRNTILSWSGQLLLTVPIQCSLGDQINSVKIADPRALQKHIKTIELNYKRAPYFTEIFEKICVELNEKHTLLSLLNEALLKRILNYLNIETKFVRSSELVKSGSKSDLVLSICQELGADKYLCGSGAESYMDFASFDENHIAIQKLEYCFKPYSQIHSQDTFVDKLSILDLLMNKGPTAIDFI